MLSDTMSQESLEQNAPQVRLLHCGAKRLDSWSYADLSDPCWRLYWNARNGAHVVLDGVAVDLAPSVIMLIPPYTAFDSAMRGRPLWHHFVHFVATAPYTTITPQIITFPATSERTAIMRRLRDYATADDLGKAWIMTSVLSLCYLALSMIPPEKLTTFYADHRIRAAASWMEHHLDQPMANAMLAGRAAMHPSAFARLFRQCTGYSPHGFLRSKRIQQACALLVTSNASLDEIATRTGFCDRYHFSRVFKAACHVSPAAYRRSRSPERSR